MGRLVNTILLLNSTVNRSVICALLVPLTVSIFAFLSLGLVPIPLIFIRYGKQLRARSRLSREAHEVIMRMGEYRYGESHAGTDEGSPGPSSSKKREAGDLEQASR